MSSSTTPDYQSLALKIKSWARELGFAQAGIADIDLSRHEAALQSWLDKGYHGDMEYMARHGMLRARPNALLPGTVRVISVRLDYLPANARFAATLKDSQRAYISRYASGRDYHKLMRQRLKKLAERIAALAPELNYRPFVDSAPILERPLAEKAGLGWVGKHSLLIDAKTGSFFFLGELLVNLPLPVDKPQPNRCGDCTACLTICPTQAIVEPYVVDARRCISYLTIEHKGSIPEELRPAIGNRIYGCDDCQLICPWNRFAKATSEADFQPRNNVLDSRLLDLLHWSENDFLNRFAGSPIRRIGYECWQRNLAVALGNAKPEKRIIDALEQRLGLVSPLVDEHLQWAIRRQKQQLASTSRKQARLIRAVERGLSHLE